LEKFFPSAAAILLSEKNNLPRKPKKYVTNKGHLSFTEKLETKNFVIIEKPFTFISKIFQS
jgi:hypothetical protein